MPSKGVCKTSVAVELLGTLELRTGSEDWRIGRKCSAYLSKFGIVETLGCWGKCFLMGRVCGCVLAMFI